MQMPGGTTAYGQCVPWVVGAVLRVDVELFTLQGHKRDFQRQKSTGINRHLKIIKKKYCS